MIKYQRARAKGDAVASVSGSLTVESIVSAAIDIADADGFDALSMRKIADRLGVGAMSLYRHVADKDALLTAMTEEVSRRFPYPVSPNVDVSDDWAVVGRRSWRECVQIAAAIDWGLYQRHPWVILAYSSPRHSMGPASLSCLDWLVAALSQLGVSRARAAEMALTVWSYIQGVALTAVSEQILRTQSSDVASTSGLEDIVNATVARDDVPPRLAELTGLGQGSGITDLRQRLDSGIESLCAAFEYESRS